MALGEKGFSRDAVKVVSDNEGYRGFFQIRKLRLRHQLFRGEWSPELTRELFVRGQAVGVLLFDPKRDAVVLVEQFRVGALDDENGPWMLELVAGMVEPGEIPEDVALRESEEEAGKAPSDLTPICRCYLSPGGSSEEIFLFYGEIDSEKMGGTVNGLDSEGEDILVHVVPSEEAFAAVKDGKIINASTIMALQWLELRKSKS